MTTPNEQQTDTATAMLEVLEQVTTAGNITPADPPPPPEDTVWEQAGEGNDRNATHYEIAARFIEAVSLRYTQRPVYCEGRFWFPDKSDNIWKPFALDRVALMVGRGMQGFSRCVKLSDYLSIAKIASGIVEDEKFFEHTTPGVVAANGFFVIENGMIVQRQVVLEDHVRYRIDYPVDPDHPAPVFKQFLEDCFATDAEQHASPEAAEQYKIEQQELLQELVGLSVIGQMSKHQVAVLLYGPAQTGKSQMLHIIEALFQDHETAASNPAQWDKEYYVADLAGKRLNIIGEFGTDKPVPIEFKAVVGGDRITGRHPTHRPFSFICQAAHFFTANHFPPTQDRSSAFFRRWRVLHFCNQRPDETKIPDLHKIVQSKEMPYVLAWALEGARRVAANNSLRTTEAHRRQLEHWQDASNNVLQFFMDEDECVLERNTGKPCKYDGNKALIRYQEWCSKYGLKALGRNTFYTTIMETGGRLGIRLDRPPGMHAKHTRHILGVGPVSSFDK